MNVKLASIGLLVMGLALPARAAEERTAQSFFNEGSSHYIKGNTSNALAVVNGGLSVFTNDTHLIRLRELLLRQQQQQNQQNKDQKDQQKQDQNQKGKDDAKDKKPQQPEKPQQDQSGDQRQKEQPQKADDQAGKPAEEMTPQEARQLLDALKQQEQSERERIQLIMGQPVPVEKDW